MAARSGSRPWSSARIGPGAFRWSCWFTAPFVPRETRFALRLRESRRPVSSILPSRLHSVVMSSHRSCAGDLVVQRDDLPKRFPDHAMTGTILPLDGLPMGPAEIWWPAVESFLNQLRLPTSMVVELPPP